MSSKVTAPRIFFLDNLRAFVVLLMVVFHVGMGYTTWNLSWWYVNDSQKSPFFDLFILSTDVYIMPIMFLIAGYFAPQVVVAKGIAQFWRDKLQRIIIPWLFGVLCIAPLIAYSAIFSRTAAPPAYVSFWLGDFWGKYYQQAHYWFLEILAIFFLLFTFLYIINSGYVTKSTDSLHPTPRFFAGFVVLCAIPFFIGNLFFPADAWVSIKQLLVIQPVRIGLYLCYFSLGVYACKHSWFTRRGYRPEVRTWSIMALSMLAVFLFYRVTYTLVPPISPLIKAGHALLFSLFSLTAAFSLIAIFQRFIDSNTYIWRRLAANSYTIYFIHQCVVIPLAYIVQNWQLSIWIKYVGVSVASVILCFIVSEYFITPVSRLIKKKQENSVRL